MNPNRVFFAIGGLGAAAVVVGFASAQSDPAELFASKCVSCHVPADKALKTDKAWISQIRETA